MVSSSTIDGVVSSIRDRKTTAAALAEKYYAKIATDDPKIGAYLTLCKDRALAKALEIDAIAAKGAPLPPLAGVPVGIKDVMVTCGVRSTAGSKILGNYIPPYDATAVARLEAAGAVVLGKINCDEFAMGSSNENSAFGPVRNPRDPDSRAWRFERRRGGGRRRRHGGGRARDRYRRLHPSAGVVLRRGRRVAHLRARVALRADRLRRHRSIILARSPARVKDAARCSPRYCRPRSRGFHFRRRARSRLRGRTGKAGTNGLRWGCRENTWAKASTLT